MLKLRGSFGLHTFQFADTNNFPFGEREPISSGELHDCIDAAQPQRHDNPRPCVVRDSHINGGFLHRLYTRTSFASPANQ